MRIAYVNRLRAVKENQKLGSLVRGLLWQAWDVNIEMHVRILCVKR
jgi:hypothetical protein